MSRNCLWRIWLPLPRLKPYCLPRLRAALTRVQPLRLVSALVMLIPPSAHSIRDTAAITARLPLPAVLDRPLPLPRIRVLLLAEPMRLSRLARQLFRRCSPATPAIPAPAKPRALLVQPIQLTRSWPVPHVFQTLLTTRPTVPLTATPTTLPIADLAAPVLAVPPARGGTSNGG